LAIVWVFEKNKHSNQLLSYMLLGDFAVRRFASIETFLTLATIDRVGHADMVLIDCDDFDDHQINPILSFLRQKPLVAVGDEQWKNFSKPFNFFKKPIDPVFITGFLHNNISRVDKGHLKIYKDLCLDFPRLSCQIIPSETFESLSRKEAMLLRFLIENVGVCVSRDQLINEVWKGIRIEARTIDSHISRLRKRLASSEVFIESVYGGGYIMS
jgi:hypothetical protein